MCIRDRHGAMRAQVRVELHGHLAIEPGHQVRRHCHEIDDGALPLHAGSVLGDEGDGANRQQRVTKPLYVGGH
eukprot:6045607-Pyramimonas_sp.AAC.1